MAETDKSFPYSHFCGNSGYLKRLQSPGGWMGLGGAAFEGAQWGGRWLDAGCCWVGGAQFIPLGAFPGTLTSSGYRSNSGPGKLPEGWSFLTSQTGLRPSLHEFSMFSWGAALCQEVLWVDARHVLCPPAAQEKMVQWVECAQPTKVGEGMCPGRLSCRTSSLSWVWATCLLRKG